MQRLTAEEQAEVVTIVEKICAVVGDADPQLALQALSYCVLGAVETSYDLSPREAVDYCAARFKRFGQVAMS